MKSQKSWMKLLLLLTMIVGWTPEARAATETVNGITWTYLHYGEEAMVGSGSWIDPPAIPTSTSGAITIPSQLGGCPVTAIGDGAFSACEKLTSVKIPSSVRNIGFASFYKCSALKNMTIPNSVTNIGNNAFDHCGALARVDIPDSVRSIAEFAFECCTALTNMTIPVSVTSIDPAAFFGCSGLKTFSVASGNPAYKAESGLLLAKDGKTLVAGVIARGKVVIPGSVTSIGKRAFFENGDLASVTIPDSVTNIGYMAFVACNSLTSVAIPDSVTGIEDDAFLGCARLTDVMIPDSVTSLGSYAFRECTALTNVTIPDSVTNIGYHAFESCNNLKTVYASEAWKSKYILDGWTGRNMLWSEYMSVPSGCTVVYLSLELDANSRTFTADAASGQILGVTADVSWTAQSSVSWLTVKTTSGTGNGSITYDVAANTGPEARTGTITVSGGGLTRTFTVTQSVKTVKLTLGASERTFTADGADGMTLAVTANVYWWAYSSVSWLTVETDWGSGNGTITYDVEKNTSTNSRTGAITVECDDLTRTFTVTQSGKTVALTLGTSERTFTADAADGMKLAVTANVSWTARSSSSWLTLTTTGGSGNGTITYSVAANTATTSRTGTITVAGGGLSRTFTVVQSGAAAKLELGATSQTFTADSADWQQLAVTANVSWTANSSASWLPLVTSSGSGNGTITYCVDTNTATTSRTGTITVAGGGLSRTFTVVQNGAAAKLELGATSQTFTADSADWQQLAVSANVAWTANSSASWLTVSTTNGSGNGTITYSVAANTETTSRTGTITVAGAGLSRTFTVTQGGVAVKLELGATSRNFTADAASGQSLAVTANVSWTAKSSAAWLTLATASGSGNGTITYSVAANTATDSRTGTITVAGGDLTRTFTVTQSGAAAKLELGTTSQSFTADAASAQTLAVTANVSWTAKSSASWLAVATASGSGNGTITYNVAANTGTASRTGTITVAGGGLTRTFTVTQDGASANLELGTTSQSFTTDAASEQKLAVMANISWTAQSSASWLKLTTASGSGNGNIVYAVTANTGTEERMGIITVTGGGLTRLFLVTQSGRTEAQESPVEVPRQWLEENAAGILAANGGDCEAAAKTFAANGLPVWKCYVADISTTDPTAQFTATLSYENAQWLPKPVPDRSSTRIYDIEGTDRLAPDAVWGPTNSSTRFFRIRVRLP